MIPLGQRHQGALLVNAWQRGFFTFLRQGWLIALDRFLRKKHLVFRIDAKTVQENKLRTLDNFHFHEIESWDDCPDYIKALPEDQGSSVDWGSQEWLARGWRLWMCTDEGELVALGWWRSAGQSRDYFCMIPADAELLWHVFVLPEYRGRNIQVQLWHELMSARASQGVSEFFTNCREYNTPSLRNIQKSGFRRIGYCTESRFSGMRRWHDTEDGTSR